MTIEIVFPLDHATAKGHFPGDPVIPGAVLLDEVLGALGIEGRPCRVRDAKFLHPVRPGNRLVLEVRTVESGTKFECTLPGGVVAASGTVSA